GRTALAWSRRASRTPAGARRQRPSLPTARQETPVMKPAKAPQRPAHPLAGAATIVEVTAPDRVRVHVGLHAVGGASTGALDAHLAQIPGYRASAGDRVVVAGDAADLYVVAVLQAAEPLALTL